MCLDQILQECNPWHWESSTRSEAISGREHSLKSSPGGGADYAKKEKRQAQLLQAFSLDTGLNIIFGNIYKTSLGRE